MKWNCALSSWNAGFPACSRAALNERAARSCCQLALHSRVAEPIMNQRFSAYSAAGNTRPVSSLNVSGHPLALKSTHSCVACGLARKDKQMRHSWASPCLFSVYKRFLPQFVSSYHVQC